MLINTLCAVLESVVAVDTVSTQKQCEREETRTGTNIQSCVVASKRFGNQVRFDKLLGLVGAQMKLEALSQRTRRRGYADGEAGHLGLATHHGDEVNNVVRGATEC